MGKTCPVNPDMIVKEIMSAGKSSLAVWGIASLIVLIAVVYIAYSMVQEIMHWHTTNRARMIRLKGRNNAYESADDDYAPHPVKQYTAPSGRTIKARLAKKDYADGRDLLVYSKDEYEEEKKDKDDDDE